ncbi:MAG: LysR family transcriptional regulator [Sneathiella sp.]|nr:LysR family transcriptional regulator [Sneathiella sp.]
MGQIEDLRVFIDIVNGGGIARAAGAMNIAKSAVSRRLKLMEDRYDVQLVDRRPGVWEVSAAGQELYQRALRVLTEADEIEADFTHARQSLNGPLSVSIPREFGLEFLQPVLLDFATRHPETQLTVDFDDRRVDLERENYDLAIRIAEEADPNLTMKKLGESQHRLYASIAYADENVLPETIETLTDHSLLHYGSGRRATWEFDTETGKQTFEFQPTLNSNSGHFLLEATRFGRGIARLPDFIASNACARGELIVVLPNARMSYWSITIAYSKTRLLNRRMRAFIEEVTEACLIL